MKQYLTEQLSHRDDVVSIKKLQGEASTRGFYRVGLRSGSRVAMVYPDPREEELSRIQRLTALYKGHGLNVPEIESLVNDRILLQQDLGDLLVQTAFKRFTRKEKEAALEKIAEMLIRLRGIPAGETAAVLDHARMKWEMDFFISHFVPHFCPPSTDPEDWRSRLHRMVERIGPIDTFAHRDFHCRNMLVFDKDIYLVDFQDSLRAPAFYDLVSFSFDAYLDLKSLRKPFMNHLARMGMEVDDEQLWLTALQRNIKALGTFGYQVTVRGNLTYKKYINRTIGHIRSNPLFGDVLGDGRIFP